MSEEFDGLSRNGMRRVSDDVHFKCGDQFLDMFSNIVFALVTMVRVFGGGHDGGLDYNYLTSGI